MNQPKDPSDEPLSVDRLESDILPPPLEVASLEYFSHAPFDERLEQLLEKATVKDSITTFDSVSSQPIHPSFPVNTIVDGMPATAFAVKTHEAQSNGIKSYSFSLNSNGELPAILTFDRKDDDNFAIFNSEDMTIETISALETALLAMRAIGISDASLRQHAGLLGEAPHEYNSFLKNIWNRGNQEFQGTQTDSYFIQTRGTSETDELRLGYKNVETPSDSLIYLTLERALIFPEFESEIAFHLEIVFSLIHSRQSAEKSIRGDGGLSVRSIRSIHSDLAGKKTPLDTSDPKIMQFFIDTYEEMLESSKLDQDGLDTSDTGAA